MATIKTSNTLSLAEKLLEKIASSMNASQEAVDEIYWAADTFKDGNDQNTGPDGAVNTTTVTETATRIELVETYRNWPDGGDEEYDARETGTERYVFTGTNLTNPSTANATQFDWSDNITLTGDGIKETDVETGSAKISFNPQTPGNLTITDFKHSEKGTITGNDDGFKFDTSTTNSLSFTGQAQYAAGDTPWESTLSSIRINTVTSNESYTSKNNEGTSGNGSVSFSMRSNTGLTWNGLGQGLEVGSTLDSISYNSLHSGKFGGQTYKASESYQSTAWSASLINSLSQALSSMQQSFDPEEADDFNYTFTNEDIDAFLEELLAGNDIISGTDLTRNELYGGAGNDTITGNKGDDLLMGGMGNDILKGGAGNDELYGDQGDDNLDGGAGNDYLNGGFGNDILKGGAGNDELFGGAGNDNLDGGAGNDLIVGGTGVDILKGGAGADIFSFSTGDSGITQATADTISDFKLGQNDKLKFDFDFNSSDIVIQLGTADKKLYATYDALLSAANQSDAKIFVGYTVADKKNGYVFIDHDGGGMDMAIKLTGITSTNKINAGSFESWNDL